MPFSIIGSAGGSIIAYLIVDNIFHALKFSVLAGLIAFLAGGFLVSNWIGDGEAG